MRGHNRGLNKRKPTNRDRRILHQALGTLCSGTYKDRNQSFDQRRDPSLELNIWGMNDNLKTQYHTLDIRKQPKLRTIS